MDGGMYTHPATQGNLDTLRQRGTLVAGPAEGHLASGMLGIGRMLEPQELLGHIRLALAQNGPLHGCKVVVTAGGTHEPIDPVRSITNRSSGKQGFAVAQAALDLGAQVDLIAGPVSLATPVGAQRQDVSTAQEMLSAVLRSIPEADALIMAAAVADFRPVDPPNQKIKRAGGLPQIQLENTPDILQEVSRFRSTHSYPRVTVGFAAESQNLLENATTKLRNKNLDLIVANDISAIDAGFAVDSNRVTLLASNGDVENLPLMGKDEVAKIVMEKVVERLGVRG
jgi:phosphopantothenoylcysteine decarboxylase/phosphopantothenate--cysteine ligase